MKKLFMLLLDRNNHNCNSVIIMYGLPQHVSSMLQYSKTSSMPLEFFCLLENLITVPLITCQLDV